MEERFAGGLSGLLCKCWPQKGGWFCNKQWQAILLALRAFCWPAQRWAHNVICCHSLAPLSSSTRERLQISSQLEIARKREEEEEEEEEKKEEGFLE